MLARGLLRISRMKTQTPSSCRGFSLIELLIVAAIIGLIVAIAVPNLVNAIQRGRQTRTVGDIKGLSTGLALYQQDYAKFPVSTDYTEISTFATDLAPYLGEGIASIDGWQRAFQYKSDGDNYTLVSFALNGVADEPWVQGITQYFDDDIVVQDGEFWQVPQGTQN
jgi:general secretion pathway protein G